MNEHIDKERNNFAKILLKGDTKKVKIKLFECLKDRNYFDVLACIEVLKENHDTKFSEFEWKKLFELADEFSKQKNRFHILSNLVEIGLDIDLIPVDNQIHIKVWIGKY